MTVRVERIGDRLGILLTEQDVAELCLQEGSEVTLVSREQAGTTAAIQYMSKDEALAAFKATEPRFAEVYRALAK
jgi:antitoxin component of MazEF toxin-antitoxin module